MDIAATWRGFEAELKSFGRGATSVRRAVGIRELRSGHWFWTVLASYLVHHESRRRKMALGSIARAERARRANAIIQRTGIYTALGGLGAGVTATAASVATAQSGALAAPVAFSIAGVTVGADMITRTLLHLRMTCDLGDLYGIEFGSGSEAELVGLYSLALGLYAHEEEDLGSDLVARLVALRDAGPGGGVGTRLLLESVLRNLVPYIGVVTSAVASFNLTRRIGRFVQSYVTHRALLDRVCARLKTRWREYWELLVEGVWFLFVADGRLTATESAILAHLVHTRPEDVRQVILSRFVADEAAWLERLRRARDDEPRELLMDSLIAAAAADAKLPSTERAILRRAADALRRPFDAQAVERMAQQAAPSRAPPA